MKTALSHLRQSVGRLLQGAPDNSAVERLIRHNQARWPRRSASQRPVVLVSLFRDRPSIWSNAYVANALADHYDAGLESCYFAGPPDPLTARIYESFGAPLGLSIADTEAFRGLAEQQAGEIFAGLKTKWDVVNITVDCVPIGDLLYDTYLRYLARGTVELQDPELRRHLLEGLLIFHACRDFLSRRRLVALHVDHLVYTNCGILTRLAFRAGVPIYQTYFGERFFLHCLTDHQSPGTSLSPVRWPYSTYPQLFAALPTDEQEDARGRGRAALQARFSGAVDHSILRAQTAYEEGSVKRIFPATEQPRMLIFLHDFCDAVHVYRDVLFTDFFEWITFLLDRAMETPFAWYVKPHPNTRDASRAAMNRTNDAIVAQLRKRYPNVTFLPSSTSNRQLLTEGVSALFTVYGTCAHEFAWHGVPVVNAGDNPHIGYHFNHHPRTLEEYARCIREADRLELPINRAEIEEFFFMNYLYFPSRNSTGAHPMDPTLIAAPDWSEKIGRPEVFDDFIHAATPEREACLREYFQRYFARPPEPCPASTSTPTVTH